MDLEATEALAARGALAEAAPGALAVASPSALASASPDALAVTPAGLPDQAGALAATPDGQAAQARATDGLQLAVEASIDALALARSLLPTAPHPARECNIPVLQVQRYILHPLDLLFFSVQVPYRNKTRFGLFIGPK